VQNPNFGSYAELIQLSSTSHKFLDSFGIDVSKFETSHVCYRPKTTDACITLQHNLRKDTDFDYISDIGSSLGWRSTSWLKWVKNLPILDGLTFEYLMVRSPLQNHKYETGFTHIAFCVRPSITLDELMALHPTLKWLKDRYPYKQMIALDVGNNQQVRFYSKTVSEMINSMS
jgi:hypothetical protein